MDYLTKNRSNNLSNEPYEITSIDLKKMHDENLKERVECEKVTESTYRGESYYDDGKPGVGKIKNDRLAFYKEVCYRDVKTSGFVMSYPHGTVIRQGERESYYRGENQMYHKSQPSLFRSLEKLSSEEDRQLYQLVADMRIAEFRDFLYRFGFVNAWQEQFSDVLYEPLAQHYGLETKWLDITNDFDVALFFATCYWDKNTERWQPLTKEQTEKTDESKYGMIFHIPRGRADAISFFGSLLQNQPETDESLFGGSVLPIGFQPFMRCHSQYAYGIRMDTPYPLQDNINFEKLYFRHSEKLSKAVYEMMDCGKRIYPQEGVNSFKDIIKSIRNAAAFSEEAFQYAFENNTYFKNVDLCRAKLENTRMFGKPIVIAENIHSYSVSEQRIQEFDKQYEDFSFEKDYGIQLHMRRVFKP